MRFILKKTGVLIVTLLLISLLAYLAFQIVPGDPTTVILGLDYTPERAAALREELGLDRNVLVRYMDWLVSALRGDWGMSYSYGIPVQEVLEGKVAVTAALSLMAWVISIGVSIPMGIVLARYQSGKLDRFFVGMNQVFMSIPAFFIGILFTYVFGLLLKWFLPGYFIPFGEDFWAAMGYLLFPAVAIALPRVAMTVRMLRSTIIFQMNSDYVRTAISRGNDRSNVLWRHVLRNAMAPVVAFLAQTMAEVVAGSIVVEQVFGVPGLGRLLLGGISGRDWPVVQSIIVILAFWVVLAGTLGDLVSQRIDPRLRLGGDGE